MKKTAFLTTALTAVVLAAAPRASAREWTFGINPQVAPARMAATWGPFLAELEKRSGVRLRMDTSPSIMEFDGRYVNGEFDFAFVNPYAYAVLDSSAQYRAFAHETGVLEGLILVLKDSRYKSLAELKGARIAFPSPYSYGSSVLNKWQLEDAGLDPEKDVYCEYHESHERAYEALLSGRAEAAAGIRRTFSQLPPQAAARLRVLHSAPPATPLPFAANKKVPADVVRKVAAALLTLPDSPEGLALLKGVGMKGVVAAVDADWNGVRRESALRAANRKKARE